MILVATLDDMAELMWVEDKCFEYDQFGADEFRYRIQSPAHDLFVHIEIGVVGYVALDYPRCSRIGNISGLAVLPTWRSNGFAKELMEHAEKAAIKSGCFAVNLECRDHLTPFYGKLGYRTVGEMPDWYEDGARAIAMWKDV